VSFCQLTNQGIMHRFQTCATYDHRFQTCATYDHRLKTCATCHGYSHSFIRSQLIIFRLMR